MCVTAPVISSLSMGFSAKPASLCTSILPSLFLLLISSSSFFSMASTPASALTSILTWGSSGSLGATGRPWGSRVKHSKRTEHGMSNQNIPGCRQRAPVSCWTRLASEPCWASLWSGWSPPPEAEKKKNWWEVSQSEASIQGTWSASTNQRPAWCHAPLGSIWGHYLVSK